MQRSHAAACSAEAFDAAKVKKAAHADTACTVVAHRSALLRDAPPPPAQVVLSKLGAKLVHCGSVGNGQVAKLCNNLLLGICMLGTR